jgi:signal recognition particle receptor subunit beta
VKTVVAGPFDGGEAQFIRFVSEMDVVSTESQISGDGGRVKEETAVAMDFGRITIDDDLILYPFGTPGQRRFDFVWEILSEGMLGSVVLIDSARPETVREARHILPVLRNYAPARYVLGANGQDVDESRLPEDLRIALKSHPAARVLLCVATDKQDVKHVILELLHSILGTMDLKAVEWATVKLSQVSGRGEDVSWGQSPRLIDHGF